MAVGLAGNAWAQPPVFDEAIDVRLVNVEAVVTDGKGDPVRGLKAEDLRLRVDGREVPIEFFTEVEEGTARPGGAASPVPAGEAVGRNYLVFVDDSFSVAGSRDRALQDVERDLSLLKPEDRMAVLAFDGGAISVLARWTGDRAVLAAALAEARRRPAHGNRMHAQNRALQSDVNMVSGSGAVISDGDTNPLTNTIDRIMEALSGRISPESRTQLGRSAPATASALRAFEAPPGRKVLLLFSGAWSVGVAGALYAPMIEAANRLGYTIYPVEVANSESTAVTAFDGLARLTGGRAVVTSKGGPFQEVVADTGTYYWLGFTPAWKANDQGHRIIVEARREGLKVRARGTFSDLSRQTANAMKSESVLLFGGDPAQKKLIVQIGEVKPAGRKQVEVTVTLGVPVDALALIPEGKGYIAQTPLAVAALDKDGGRAEMPVSTLRVQLKEPPRGGGYARFQTKVRLRKVEQRLVFTVHDPVQGAALWGEAEFKPQREAQ